MRQRQDMLTAALELFSEKGYHNASMQEVAERAEFAVGTLYKFFKNKEDLYNTLIWEQFDTYDKAFARALAADDEVEKLRSVVRVKGDQFRHNLAFVRLYLEQGRGIGYNIKADLNDTLRARYVDYLQKLAAVFESGIRKKRFKAIAGAFELAVAFDSTLNSFLLLWLDAPERHPYPENPDTILNIFFKGLMAL